MRENAIELHHAVVFTSPGAPEADRLKNAGFVEGPAHRHLGQGTANRRFFFANIMLELLWVADVAEAGACALSRCGLLSRADAHRTGSCPLGLALAAVSMRHPLFPSWSYQPSYLPESTTINIAKAADDPQHPLLFELPQSYQPPPDGNSARLAELEIALGGKLTTPLQRSLKRVPLLKVTECQETLLRLRLRGVGNAGELDLRPALPLIVAWS